jgi:hypothetical protein
MWCGTPHVFKLKSLQFLKELLAEQEPLHWKYKDEQPKEI